MFSTKIVFLFSIFSYFKDKLSNFSVLPFATNLIYFNWGFIDFFIIYLKSFNFIFLLTYINFFKGGTAYLVALLIFKSIIFYYPF